MFNKSELRDLCMMVEDYLMKSRSLYASPVATESGKRELAVSILKAETLIEKIKENVKTFDLQRNES